MTVPSLAADLQVLLPKLRGRLVAEAPLKDITWFRVGGAAEVLYTPADEADLAYFMAHVPTEVPVFVIGLCSNLIVRDGGIRGVVVRLGRGFGEIEVLDRTRIRAGTAVPDVKVARASADAGIAGLSFYRGIPGGLGGALRMNAGAHGSETKDVLLSARAVDRAGRVHELSNADMGFTYRRSAVPQDWIFTSATFEGTRGEPEEIVRAMDEVAAYREKHQPIKERTGGSTFKNPPDNSAWKLVDAAGCRGLRVGGAMVSEMHCNFLINDRQASAEDIERLGETVRARVRAATGIELQWEIVRVGDALPGHVVGVALVEEHAP
ncbi:MAG: UDP-N-acetylenolpyruvoylglucosamine reductase [Hyphomicrobium sp. SCN 65-11]|nr:MAG: UDP-N-acetylenolpyruvoylglucosamine reductase [Hyphomicrobium sp. SCN 65-11]